MLNKRIFILELLSKCNSKCAHCLRLEKNYNEFKLSFNQIKNILDRIFEFKTNQPNIEVKLSGGEPTIWMEKNKNITDIFNECDLRNIKFSLISNGKIFIKYENIDKILGSYFDNNTKILSIYFTVDIFHENCDLENNTSIVLDNFYRYIKENKLNNKLLIYVQSTVSNNESYNISKKFIKKYSEKGFKFNINPLLPWGNGVKLNNLVPNLILKGNEKNTLGDYKKYIYTLGKSLKKWKNMDEFNNISNIELFSSLTHCGKTITIQNGKFYYCMAHSGTDKFFLGNEYTFKYDNLEKFEKSNFQVLCFKNYNSTKNYLESRVDLWNNKYSFGYGVCDICKYISK